MNAKNGSDVPLGLGMALMQNTTAYEKFANLSSEAQQQLIGETHAIKSKQEMRSFVQNIAEN